MRHISCAVYTEYSFASSTSWTVALDVSCQTRQQLVGIHNSSTLTLENRVENVQHDIYIVAQNQAINGKRYRVQNNWVRTFHLGCIISTLFSMFRRSAIQKYFTDFLLKRTKCSPARDCECYGCVLTTSWMMMMMVMMMMMMMMMCAFYFVEEGGNA